MSLSGSSYSRKSIWAQIRLATVSSIGVPRMMIRSLSKPGVQVVAPLAPARLLDDGGDQVPLGIADNVHASASPVDRPSACTSSLPRSPGSTARRCPLDRPFGVTRSLCGRPRASRPGHGFPVLVDQRPRGRRATQCLRLPPVRAYRGEPACAVESAPQIGRRGARLLRPSRPPRASRSSSLTWMSSASASARRARSRRTARVGSARISASRLVLGPDPTPGGTARRSDVPLPRAGDRGRASRSRTSASTRASGGSSATSPTSASTVRSRRASWACTTLSWRSFGPQVVFGARRRCRTPTPPPPTRRSARAAPSRLISLTSTRNVAASPRCPRSHRGRRH